MELAVVRAEVRSVALLLMHSALAAKKRRENGKILYLFLYSILRKRSLPMREET